MEKKRISVITPTCRWECIENIISNFNRQDYAEKELIIIINKDDIDRRAYCQQLNEVENAFVYKITEKIKLGECLNLGVSKAHYEYIARFDDDDYYGPQYLKDAIREMEEKKCDILGKRSTLCYYEEIKLLIQRGVGFEEQYNTLAGGATMFFKREVFEKVRFCNVQRSEDGFFLRDAMQQGLIVYSGNIYHILVKRTVDGQGHTNQRKLEVYKASPNCKIIAEDISYEDAIAYVNTPQQSKKIEENTVVIDK